MILKRKTITLTALLLCICMLCLISNKSTAFVPSNASKINKPKIIIDAGHGGFDGGAVAPDGTVEKNINLNICLALSEWLRMSGYEVIMTREGDNSTEDKSDDKIAARKKSDLRNRLKLMSDYPDAVFVSIHLNKFTTSAANGSQVFYSTKTEESRKLGDDIQKSIVKLLQPENTRVNKPATSGTYLLYNATIPAVLVECGFLSNPSELEKLKKTEYQKQMAFSIYCGITEYFSNKKEI